MAELINPYTKHSAFLFSRILLFFLEESLYCRKDAAAIVKFSKQVNCGRPRCLSTQKLCLCKKWTHLSHKTQIIKINTNSSRFLQKILRFFGFHFFKLSVFPDDGIADSVLTLFVIVYYKQFLFMNVSKATDIC